VPVIPALLFCLALVLERLFDAGSRLAGRHEPGRVRLAIGGVLLVAAAAGVMRYAPRQPGYVGYTADMILQKDLAEAVRPFVRPFDRTLMYEIQAQYYFPGFGVSADGIVGREAHDFLRKRESFDRFVSRERIAFLVTFNGFNYRRIYAGTPLVDIYSHDLRAAVGESICLGGFCFEKMATNPHFSSRYIEVPSEGLNTGTTMRMYDGSSDPILRGRLIQWNSVYRIRPRQAAAGLARPTAAAHLRGIPPTADRSMDLSASWRRAGR
jgi:hypothetical protein